jgi:hypothetical protein
MYVWDPVAVVVAEGLFTRTQLSDSAKGRPSLLVVFGSTAGLGLVSILLWMNQKQLFS